MKNLPTSYNIPRVALLCPACNNETTPTEIIERKGYVGCLSCVK